MRPHDGFDVKLLLVAEVVVDSGHIGFGLLTDVANRRAVKTAVSKHLPRRFQDSFASGI
jgi:hypothetical protein